VDEEGFLYLTDRKSFMIISGGVNIYPQETENLLVTHPKVMDVAVFGVPHEEFGEEVKAVVQPVDWNDKVQYERLLGNGKSKMCAIGAAMRKLVHICYGVVKNQEAYTVQSAIE